ncbi:uncharacterized protein [Montipora capricornis]|uniref:uncharacterized protein isoform X1 n=1 Tax=Montipora capricornis TaxID=246305 RepID=UPI0035F14CD4
MDPNTDNQSKAQVIFQGGPVAYNIERQYAAPLREEPPNDYRLFSIISIFFCPLLGLLALVMSFVTNKRYEEDDLKRAHDASKDAKFSAILAVVFGFAIGIFCIFIFEIVPVLGD